MTRIDLDYKLKKMANFFKFFPCILKKSLKTDYNFFLVGVTKCFPPSAIRTISF